MKYCYRVSWKEIPENVDSPYYVDTVCYDFTSMLNFLDLLENRRARGLVNDIWISSMGFEVDENV